MGAVYPDQPEWTSDIETIATQCYDEVTGAHEAGETLDWVEELRQRGDQLWDETPGPSIADTSSLVDTSMPVASEPRSSAAPEWIGVEYREEMDYDVEEIIYLDVRTTPPTRLEVYGGSAIGPFWNEPFNIVEFYTTPDMDTASPGERLLLMVEDTDDGTWLVLDAIRVTQKLNERLLECESPEAEAVLALAFGVLTDTGTDMHVVDAWEVFKWTGFDTTSTESVHCTHW
jgi:hypothetical protein